MFLNFCIWSWDCNSWLVTLWFSVMLKLRVQYCGKQTYLGIMFANRFICLAIIWFVTSHSSERKNKWIIWRVIYYERHDLRLCSEFNDFLLAEENMLFAILKILVIQINFKTNKYYCIYDMIWYLGEKSCYYVKIHCYKDFNCSNQKSR